MSVINRIQPQEWPEVIRPVGSGHRVEQRFRFLSIYFCDLRFIYANFDLFLRTSIYFYDLSIYLCELRYDPVMGIVQLSYLYVDIKYAVLI